MKHLVKRLIYMNHGVEKRLVRILLFFLHLYLRIIKKWQKTHPKLLILQLQISYIYQMVRFLHNSNLCWIEFNRERKKSIQPNKWKKQIMLALANWFDSYTLWHIKYYIYGGFVDFSKSKILKHHLNTICKNDSWSQNLSWTS